MTDKEFEIFIKEQDFIGDDFFETSFNFWFNDNEHIRTPFPEEWVYELSDEEKSKLDNEEIAETFEMILFNQAMELVKSEDEKITICYPFMPRVGDVVEDKEKGESTVIERELKIKDDEKKYLKLKLKPKKSTHEWETEFEVPA